MCKSRIPSHKSDVLDRKLVSLQSNLCWLKKNYRKGKSIISIIRGCSNMFNNAAVQWTDNFLTRLILLKKSTTEKKQTAILVFAFHFKIQICYRGELVYRRPKFTIKFTSIFTKFLPCTASQSLKPSLEGNFTAFFRSIPELSVA